MPDVSMTLSQIELALLGGLPLHKLDQLIASRCAPIYARPSSRRVACYTLHEGIQLGMTFLDGTSIRAHQKAAGAARKGALQLTGTPVRRWAARVGGYGTKACVIADG